MKSEIREGFPLKVRIDQINNGKITITHETMTVKSENDNFGSSQIKFIRVFNMEELDSIELATSLISSEESFKKFSECYKAAKELFKCLKLLYYLGNPYHVFTNKFSNLVDKQGESRYISRYICFLNFAKQKMEYFGLNSEVRFEINFSIYCRPILPKFLTVENILFLSKFKNPKENLQRISIKIQDYIEDPQLKNYPYLSMINLLTNHIQPNKNESVFFNVNYDKSISYSTVEEKFNRIKNFDKLNSIHFIKVDKPVHCFHLLYLVSKLFIGIAANIGQILYCHKNTNILQYLNEFKSLHHNSFYKFIIFHPEFLDESNRNILIEESKARISAVSIRDSKKILIISSMEFTKDNDFVTYFDNDDITCCRLTSISSLPQPDIKGCRLESNSCQNINNSDGDIQFIDKENQHIQFLTDKAVRLKFSPELFDDCVDFWDELISSVFFDHYISDKDVKFYDSANDFKAIFEEPFPGLIQDLNDFPFPLKKDARGTETVPFPTFEVKKATENQNKNEKSVKNLLDSLVSKSSPFIKVDDTLLEVIKKLYLFFFKVDEFDQKVPIHLLRYISDYIVRYSTSYIDCLWDDDVQVRRFRASLLIMSALFVYGLAPKNEYCVMCFNGMLDKNLNDKDKTIDFYTTRKKADLPFHTKVISKSISPKFAINLLSSNSLTKTKSTDRIDSINPNENNKQMYFSFIKCLTRNDDVSKEISKLFDDNQLNNFHSESLSKKYSILNYTLSIPKFYKAISIVSRLSLSHPTILSGDTGCGKTSFIHMFQRLVEMIPNCKIKFYPDLNIHGDVNRKEIEKHLQTSLQKDKECNTFFFDEFNTSDSLPFIEHIFINGYFDIYNRQKINFLGAINPLIKADSISKVLSKIGMEQNIFTQNETVSLLNLKKTDENLNDYKYFVHKLNESEDLIIDFNPVMMDSNKESQFLPNEEKNLIRRLVNLNDINNESFINELFTSIEWIRQFMRENAVVSTRDVKSVIDFYNRFNVIIKNHDKNEFYCKQSFDLAIISVFALRLPLTLEIPSENHEVLNHVKSINMEMSEDERIIYVRRSFLNKIGNFEDLMNLFDKFTYWFLRKNIMKDKSIWKFKSFLYHVVIMKLTIQMKKACFVIGPPGTSKSFALEQIAKDDNTFVTTYMCSRGSSSEGLKAQFYDAVYIGKTRFNNKMTNNSVISFEEMGLANINKRRPLKYIHFALDLGIEINDDHHYEKVASIGVSNYAMDLANMNRGTLIYTDIPSLIELKINFSNNIVIEECDKVEFVNFDPIYNKFLIRENVMKEKVGNDWIEDFFKALWPNNSKPKTLALRSIYSLYQITKEAYFESDVNKKISTNFFCKIAREIVNARRLIKIDNNNQINEDFKDLAISAFDFILRMFPDNLYDIPDELLEKPENVNSNSFEFEILEDRTIKCTFKDGQIEYFKIMIDNLYIMLNRIISKDSFKSLCLLTKDYSALDNIRYILLENLPKTTGDLQFILNSKDAEKVVEKIKNMPPSKCPDISYYFEEDFKSTDSATESQKSVNNFIQAYMKNPNEIPVIVGNNPMLDSLLDILNANKINSSNSDETFNALISSDGFSWSYNIRTDFYLVLIMQLEELISKMGVIPLPLLDRLEIVYIDWSLLKYLSYFKLIINSDRFVDEFINSGLSYKEFVDQIDDQLNEYLNLQTLHDNDENCSNRFHRKNADRFLHSSLIKLFERFYRIRYKKTKNTKLKLISNEDLNDFLSYTHWKSSIKCVIYTKSMLGDRINFQNIKEEDDKEAFKYELIDDETVADEEQFNKCIESFDKSTVLVIKCSKYSEMHDQHLKKLIEKKKFEGSVFIIYYYTGRENIKSTMNWPVFWIEDISDNFLVMNSENSSDLISIYENLGNKEYVFRNKKIMDELIKKRLVEYLSITSTEDLLNLNNNFKYFIEKYYHDDSSNLIDNFDEFHEDPNSPYSIQTQIFNHLMNQIKNKLLYFINILFGHFVTNMNSTKNFLSKKVYDFLRENYKELPNKLFNVLDYQNHCSDFKSILNDSVTQFLNNSPYFYFPNTFDYRFLTVVNESNTFHQFIELFKKQNYRNRFYKESINSNEEIQFILRHLNRKGFRINKEITQKMIQLLNNNDEFHRCTEELLLSKGISINSLLDPDKLIDSYDNYQDARFCNDINLLISKMNSNEKDDFTKNSFTGIFVYFDYILNLNVIELLPEDQYEDIEKFYTFTHPGKNDRNTFWNSFILSYIFSKKLKDKEIALSYRELIDDLSFTFFDLDEDKDYDLSQNAEVGALFSIFYSKLFFTAPQIAYCCEKVDAQFKKLVSQIFGKLNEIERQEEKPVDLVKFESLIRSSCILELPQIPKTPEKSLFERFTNGFEGLKYCDDMVNRIHGIPIIKNSTPVVSYSWSSIKGEIESSQLVKKLIETGELSNIVDAPSLNGHPLLEVIHLYMTDVDSFEQMMKSKDDCESFVNWFLQDGTESPLFIVQIYLLFRSVHCKNEELMKNQLIALLSLSAPWKVINEANLNEYADSKYNFFAFSIIKAILALPEASTRKEVIESIPDGLKLLDLLKSATEGNGGYSFIDGNDLYVMSETFPTISTVIYNHFVFNNQREFPLFKSFIQIQKHRHFLNTATQILRVVFKLRKLFARNSRALFVILNCFSFVRHGEYELVQDLPLISGKFDKLFQVTKGESRDIFTLSDLGGCQNAYEQIEFVSKTYFKIHNEFVAFRQEGIVLPVYDFIPKMAITVFDFNKYLADRVLNEFIKIHTVYRKFHSPTEINDLLVETLDKNLFPLVTFDLDRRFEFDFQPTFESPQKVDFLGMCKGDWTKVLSLAVNRPDANFIGNMKKDLRPNSGCDMTKVAAFLLQIYYREKPEDDWNGVFTHLDFGDSITINMGFEIPEIILDAPIFEYLPDELVSLIRNVL